MKMSSLAGVTKPLVPSNALSPPLSLRRAQTSRSIPAAFQSGGLPFAVSSRKFSILNCRGIEVLSVPNRSRHFAASNSSDLSSSCSSRNYDIATLGNLCVDIVLKVPELPPAPKPERKAYMDKLAASPPDKKHWEAGGNCNTAIAAARLGLQCVALGYVGDEIYGQFVLDVLRDEGIDIVRMSEELEGVDCSSVDYETLLCWVLVDPFQRHGFCSRLDFTEEPAFSWMHSLTGEVKTAIQRSKILFVNGYGFDELSPALIVSALNYAAKVGTCVFFDPGPRGKSLSTGTPEQQLALSEFLKKSDVLLLTSDEADSLTGITDPILAGKHLLKQGVRTKWVVIKMGSSGSVLISLSSTSCAPTFKVKVVDTVGCGDSFVAGIAYGFVRQMSTVHILTLANAVGAATAMGIGAGRNVAKLEQVKKLITSGDLNDDCQWKEAIDKSSDDQEVTLLSKEPADGEDGRLKHLSLDKIVPEVIGKLESTRIQVVST
ncbi:hypothetical protein V2J09_020112 [Rumex salicifolius]